MRQFGDLLEDTCANLTTRGEKDNYSAYMSTPHTRSVIVSPKLVLRAFGQAKDDPPALTPLQLHPGGCDVKLQMGDLRPHVTDIWSATGDQSGKN